MRSVVTGVAGFIGSHLAEYLVSLGHEVIGIDCFTSYYDPALKHANIAPLLGEPRFQLVEADLTTVDLGPVIAGADYLFHQAAQAGVRASWGENFTQYTRHNVMATQRLLEACLVHPPRALVYASSSSVYGNAPLPMREDARPQPLSPYGMTKLAGEHLCALYAQNHGIPTVILRYFTVYGPRQRPDMGIDRFIRALLRDEPITVHGDGEQSRDFTYVADIVRANVLAAERIDAVAGEMFNVGGGSRISVNALLALLAELTGHTPRLQHGPPQKGDVHHTGADCSRAARLLDFVPAYDLRDGLAQQVVWQRAMQERARSNHLVVGSLQRPAGVQHRPTQGWMQRSPRILLYSHDTFGLGHLRRNLAIAGRLAHTLTGASLLLLSGSQAAQQFMLPPGTDLIKLPSVTKLGHEQYGAQTLALSPREILALRRSLILETVAGFRPDLLLVDHAPLGVRGELRPALEYLRTNLPESRVVLGVRDILDEPAVVRATWHEQGMYQALEAFYDRLFVYGVPEVCDPIADYELPPAVAARTTFCGYIRRDDPIIAASQARRAIGVGERDLLVLVTVGGGGDGTTILETYLRALQLGPAGWTSVLVTGPFLPDADRSRLEDLCRNQSSVVLLPFVHDLPSLMHAADAAISMGGYNSLCELTSSGRRAIVIPRTSPRTEQLLRATAFARLGLVDLLLPEHATPMTLRSMVQDALARGTALPSGRPGTGSRLTLAARAVLQNGLDRLVPAMSDLLPRTTVAEERGALA